MSFPGPDASSTFRAQLALRCCGTNKPVSMAGPCWQLYVVMFGLTEWPVYTWPTSTDIPFPDERAAALAELGYEPTPATEWNWSEDVLPSYHGHPEAVALIASISVQPLSYTGEGAR